MIYIKQDWSSEVFQQIKGDDFICTYSPTIVMDSFKLSIAITSIYKWDLRQTDIKAVYINANLDKKIYVQITIGDKNFHCGKICIITKGSL